MRPIVFFSNPCAALLWMLCVDFFSKIHLRSILYLSLSHQIISFCVTFSFHLTNTVVNNIIFMRLPPIMEKEFVQLNDGLQEREKNLILCAS